jgi:hypothetical protein
MESEAELVFPEDADVGSDGVRETDAGKGTGLTANIEIVRICGARDQAVKLMDQAVALLELAHQYAKEAQQVAAVAADNRTFNRRDRKHEAAYRMLFHPVDGTLSRQTFREDTDASIWVRLLNQTGM